MLAGIKCVIFDMDGVITETSEQHYQAWSDTAKKLGINLTREINEQLKGISRMESLEIILRFGNMENTYSQEEKEEFAASKNEKYVSLIQEITSRQLFDGVKPIFQLLKSKGIRIAIGSASKNAPLLVDRLGISEYVDYIVDPAKVKNGKPEPDIFLAAATRFGLEPSECIGVEDAKSGVDAILSAGMSAVGIGKYEILGKAHVVFPTMSAFNRYLQQVE